MHSSFAKMIKVSQLTKTYRVYKKNPGLKGTLQALFKREWIDKVALDHVNLQIEPGEIVGLVGANGAGKTTLVKILSGIIHPTSGDVKVMGYTPFERKYAFRKQISLIMGQKAQLWWDLPAEDCFMLLKEIYEIPEDVYKKNLAHLVDALDVSRVMNIQIRRLSLGERMKMELIAALLHQPKVVFLDEPTIGLDMTAQKAVRDFILDYREKHKPIMILTSHYMEDIKQLAKRLVIIKDGKFVYDGDLDTIAKKHHTHKLINVTLGMNAEIDPNKLLLKHSEIIQRDGDLLKFKVDANEVTAALNEIFKTLEVSDVKVEEEDIADVIENLMKRNR